MQNRQQQNTAPTRKQNRRKRHRRKRHWRKRHRRKRHRLENNISQKTTNAMPPGAANTPAAPSRQAARAKLKGLARLALRHPNRNSQLPTPQHIRQQLAGKTAHQPTPIPLNSSHLAAQDTPHKTIPSPSPLTTVKTLHRYETANALDTLQKHITSHNSQKYLPL